MYHNTFLFVVYTFITALARCVYADEVPANLDPSDKDTSWAWESQYGRFPYRAYRSSPLTPPAVRRVIDSPESHDGRYVIATPRGDAIKHPGPIIMDVSGELVWMHDETGQQPYNFKVQQYKGEQVLTYWLGNDGIGGHGEGVYVMLDTSYNEITRIKGLNNLRPDLHEFTITADGTGLVSYYHVRPFEHLGRRVYIWDCYFQAIDLEKDEVLFEWSAADHHGLDESYSEIGNQGLRARYPFDWYHLNSVQKDELGNYLVSARYVHHLEYINGTTGEVIWVLGGKGNKFKDISTGEVQDIGEATNFASQHYARMHDLSDFPQLLSAEIAALKDDGKTHKIISLFDNGADDRVHTRAYSRGMLIHITYPAVDNWATHHTTPSDEPTHTARLVMQYVHPDGLSADSQGSMQVIPALVEGQDPTIGLGFGQRPVWTEFRTDGTVLCDMHFAPKVSLEHAYVQSYRVFKESWHGWPSEAPRAVLGGDAEDKNEENDGDGEEDSVYVSWNGATEVRSYVLQHSSRDMDMTPLWTYVDRTARSGFETRIQFDGELVKRYVRVLALDVDGNVLGTSNSVDRGFLSEYLASDNSTSKALETSEEAFDFASFTTTTPIKLVMMCLCATSFVLTLYACWRQFCGVRQRVVLGYERLLNTRSRESSIV